MNNNVRIMWQNLATERINLRYPNVDLNVFTDLEHNNKIIEVVTFIPNKQSNRLLPIKRRYASSYFDDIFNVITEFKKRFNEDCENYKNNGIFNDDTTIFEPYEINKLKNYGK